MAPWSGGDAGPRRDRGRRRRPGALDALLAALVALPLTLMAVGAWNAWHDAWSDAAADLRRTAGAAAEHAQRVLSGHAVAAGRVDALLRGLSDAEIRARERELHLELNHLVSEVPQAEASFVVDRDGHPLVNTLIFPTPRGPPFAADRDFFLALREPGAPAIHVSQVHRDRIDGSLFFAVSRRRTRTGNGGVPAGSFDGLITLAAYPNRIAEGLRRLAGSRSDVLLLIRTDREVLACTAGQDGPTRLPEGAHFMATVAAGAERALYEAASVPKGERRLYALHRVEGWPVYAVAGRPRAAILAAWRVEVARQLAVGVPATLGLLGLALLVRHGQRGLAAANEGLEARVAERTAELAESEARLRLALGAGGMGIWEWSIATGVVRWDAATYRLCGPPPEGVTDHDAAFEALLHPEDRPVRAAAFRRAFDGDGEYRCEYRIRRADTGEERWLAARGRVLKGPDGRPARVIGVNFDVTERKAAEAALHESEARLRLAQEAAGAGAWEIDLTTGHARLSPESLRLLALPEGHPEEFDAARWAGVIHPEDYPPAQAAKARAIAENGLYDFTFRVPLPDGSVRWIQGVGRAEYAADGRPLRLLGLNLDVTERKAAEAALAASEAEFRATFESSAVGQVQLNVETGRFLRVNRRYCEITGYSAAELLGGMSIRDLTHPEDRASDEALFRELAGGGSGYEVEKRYRRRDGRVIWVRVTAAPLRDPDGQVRRMMTVVQDITERKAAEERQALLTRELDHRAKNALAVVQAALRLTPKDDPDAYARAVEGRVAALARAHTLLAEGRWKGAPLGALVEAELAAFLPASGVGEPDGAEAAHDGQSPALPLPRVLLDGPALTLTPAATQALSMALHELATNAVKHGALSRTGGRVVVSWRADHAAGLLRLRWEEHGGPPVPAPPARRGFGSRVIEATARDQLGGRVERRWEAEGLVCEIEAPLGRVLASADGQHAAAALRS